MTAARLVQSVALVAVVTTGGCVSLTDAPPPPAPNRIPSDGFAAATAAGERSRAGWIQAFGQPELIALVDEAIASNPDLYRLAAVRDEADALLRVARSSLMPRLTGVGLAQREDTGQRSPSNTYQLGVEVGWELDLWGRVRSQSRAAELDAEATALQYEYARRSLAATVAEAWFTAIAAKHQIEIDEQLLSEQLSTAEIARRRAAEGQVGVLDDRLTSAGVAQARASLAASHSAFADATRAIELLIGRYPKAELAVADALPELPPLPELGLPAELLERRPDLVAAERGVAAAFYRVHAAKAARLPSVNLATNGGTLFDPAEEIWSLAAQVLAPLFTGGELQARVEVADARQRQAVSVYIATALDAFEEVESALTLETSLTGRIDQFGIAVAELDRAVDIAQRRYNAGLLTIFDLNTTRQQYFDVRSRLLQLRAERLRQRVNLHLALGGDFQDLNRADGVAHVDHDTESAGMTSPPTPPAHEDANG